MAAFGLTHDVVGGVGEAVLLRQGGGNGEAKREESNHSDADQASSLSSRDFHPCSKRPGGTG